MGSRVSVQRKFRNVFGTGTRILLLLPAPFTRAYTQHTTVRYTGEVEFEDGYWVGVELDFPAGQ